MLSIFIHKYDLLNYDCIIEIDICIKIVFMNVQSYKNIFEYCIINVKLFIYVLIIKKKILSL